MIDCHPSPSLSRMDVWGFVNPIPIVSMIALKGRHLLYLGHYFILRLPIASLVFDIHQCDLHSRLSSVIIVFSKLLTSTYLYRSESPTFMLAKRIKQMMEHVQGNIQKAFSLMVYSQRSQATLSSHPFGVLESW